METKLALYLNEVNSASSYRALSMFVLIFPRLALPFVQDRKWKKNALLSERSEFQSFPIFWPAQMGTRRAVTVAVAFLCFLSLAKQRKEVAVGPPPTSEPKKQPHEKRRR